MKVVCTIAQSEEQDKLVVLVTNLLAIVNQFSSAGDSTSD